MTTLSPPKTASGKPIVPEARKARSSSAARGLRAVTRAIEAAVGSRAEMADMLTMVGCDERFAKLCEYLRSPDYGRHSIFSLLGFCKIRGDEFMRLMREAVMLPSQLQVQATLAQQTPEVVTKTLEDAKDVWHGCPACDGTGKRGAVACPDCQGLGKVFLKPNLTNRKLALEMAGLIGRGAKGPGGVSVTVNQAFGVPDFEDRLSHALPVEAEVK